MNVKESFNFNVVRLPLAGPDNTPTPHYGLFRDDTGECVGNAVSARYIPHNTEDILKLTEAAEIAFGGIAETVCHWHNGHNVMISPSREERKAIFGTKDNIFPRCMISARYDGRPFRASMGFYRDVCKNLAMPRAISEATAVIRHTKSSSWKINTLVSSFERIRDSWTDIENFAVAMENRRVDLENFLTQVYGVPADNGRGLTMHKNRTEAIFRRILNERVATGRDGFKENNFNVSLWEAYNSVQGYTQHDGGIRETNLFTRILKAADNQHVIKAEAIAMSMIA